MSVQNRLKLDHFNSVVLSVVLNAILLTCLILLVDLDATPTDPSTVSITIAEPVPFEEIISPDVPEEEPVLDQTTDLPSLQAPQMADLTQETEFEKAVEPLDNNLLIDTISPVTLSGMMVGIPRRGGGGFGSKEGGAYDLVGTMIDLKRDKKGKPRDMSYSADIGEMISSGFSESVMRKFMVLPRQLHLSHLFVPLAKARTGPEAFGVADLMEPRGWVVHYQGWIQSPLPGEYRFVGEFDDIIVVMIDGKVVMESNWGNASSTSWSPTHAVNRHKGFNNQSLVYGDWLPLDDKPHKIDLLVGEHPGGLVGGLLMIQEKGHSYRKAANGRPILPPFTLRPLHDSHVARMQSVRNFPMETRLVPVFGVNIHDQSPDASEKEDPVSFQIL